MDLRPEPDRRLPWDGQSRPAEARGAGPPACCLTSYPQPLAGFLWPPEHPSQAEPGTRHAVQEERQDVTGRDPVAPRGKRASPGR